MTASAIEAPPRAHPARQKALDSFLTKLRGWNGTAAAAEKLDRPARITIGRRTVTLEPWDRVQLRGWFAAGEAAEPRGPYLLAHGAALMLKSSADIERVAQSARSGGPTADMYALQAELMLDAAIGMALMKDLQQAVEDAVKTGVAEEAKGLTQFRHQLVRVVNDAKLCIADSEREQAALLADTLSDGPDVMQSPSPGAAATSRPTSSNVGRVAAGTRSEGRTAEIDRSDVPHSQGSGLVVQGSRRRRRKPDADRRRQAGDPVRIPTSTEVLVLLCGMAATCWLLFTQVPQLLHHETTVVKRGHFADSLPIESVVSRAPSVFVTIPASAWGKLDRSERMTLIQELGRSAAREGATGLVLSDDGGIPVAHWLDRRGADLIEAHEPAGPATQPPAEAPQVIIRAVGAGEGD